MRAKFDAYGAARRFPLTPASNLCRISALRSTALRRRLCCYVTTNIALKELHQNRTERRRRHNAKIIFIITVAVGCIEIAEARLGGGAWDINWLQHKETKPSTDARAQTTHTHPCGMWSCAWFDVTWNSTSDFHFLTRGIYHLTKTDRWCAPPASYICHWRSSWALRRLFVSASTNGLFAAAWPWRWRPAPHSCIEKQPVICCRTSTANSNSGWGFPKGNHTFTISDGRCLSLDFCWVTMQHWIRRICWVAKVRI